MVDFAALGADLTVFQQTTKRTMTVNEETAKLLDHLDLIRHALLDRRELKSGEREQFLVQERQGYQQQIHELQQELQRITKSRTTAFEERDNWHKRWLVLDKAIPDMKRDHEETIRQLNQRTHQYELAMSSMEAQSKTVRDLEAKVKELETKASTFNFYDPLPDQIVELQGRLARKNSQIKNQQGQIQDLHEANKILTHKVGALESDLRVERKSNETLQKGIDHLTSELTAERKAYSALKARMHGLNYGRSLGEKPKFPSAKGSLKQVTTSLIDSDDNVITKVIFPQAPSARVLAALVQDYNASGFINTYEYHE